MPDRHYENPGIAELYDLGNPWSADRDFYVSLARSPGSRILDLGCGTGLLCDAYAALNNDVTGADPSPAMLEIARRKRHGKEIEWVQSCAQNYRSDKLFDLIVMTGHAFQALLEDGDVLATFTTMRKHLDLGGVVAFESRNPAIDWAARWNYDMALESPRGVVHESRRFVAMEKDRMSFELHYRFPDESFVSRSELRFSSRTEIDASMTACGLRLQSLLGDWAGKAFDETSSHEMIFIARAA